MADWYVSSANYATLPVWQATHAYSVGDLVKPTAPAAQREYVFRCTVAGTSAGTEPTWGSATADGSTLVSGGVTFMNVSGRSAHGWTGAAGSLLGIVYFSGGGGRALSGDRIFIASDHSENFSSNCLYSPNGATQGFGLVQFISVNRAGSVPPVAADIQNGASLTATVSANHFVLDAWCNTFWQGITFTLAPSGGASTSHLYFNQSGKRSFYLKNCAIVITHTDAGCRIATASGAKVTLDNTTIAFGNVGQGISGGQQYLMDFNWINTPSAIQGAIIPTTLFTGTTYNGGHLVTCRGVDLSAITTTLCTGASVNGGTLRALFDSCKIAPGVARLAPPIVTISDAGNSVELMNCFDGTNIINERHTYVGRVDVVRDTYMDGGALDDVSNYSLKLSPNARVDFQTMALDSFWLDVENVAVGASKTATVEVISAATLTDRELRLRLEYADTVGSSVTDFLDSLASVLTTPSSLPSSSETWTAATATSALSPFDLSNMTLSNNNLTATPTTTQGGVRGADAFYADKIYWECTATGVVSVNGGVGIGLAAATFTSGPSANVNAAGVRFNGGEIYLASVFQAYISGSAAGLVNGDVIGIAIDVPAAKLWMRKGAAGNWNGSGSANPATGAGGFDISSLLASGRLYPWLQYNAAGDGFTVNFGASSFVGSVPSGFKAGLILTATVEQQLQVTFTPRLAGRVRGLVRTSAACPVWINPQMTIE